jgi:hypothetical protein
MRRLWRFLRPPIYARRIQRAGDWYIATAACRVSGDYVAWAKMGPITGRSPMDEPGGHVWFQFGATREQAIERLYRELGICAAQCSEGAP